MFSDGSRQVFSVSEEEDEEEAPASTSSSTDTPETPSRKRPPPLDDATFAGFARRWHAAWLQWQARGRPLDEWSVYCHLLPQHHQDAPHLTHPLLCNKTALSAHI